MTNSATFDEMIFEAVQRPTMKFVATKTAEHAPCFVFADATASCLQPSNFKWASPRVPLSPILLRDYCASDEIPRQSFSRCH
jgi:hypothetical protein